MTAARDPTTMRKSEPKNNVWRLLSRSRRSRSRECITRLWHTSSQRIVGSPAAGIARHLSCNTCYATTLALGVADAKGAFARFAAAACHRRARAARFGDDLVSGAIQ